MLRLGVIGHGGRMSSLIKNVFRQVDPDLRIVGIVDPDTEGASNRLHDCDRDDAVFYESVEQLVTKGKPDALAIGTRCNLHTPYALEAAKYDLPLYLEKPVSVTMEQATALERAFENSKCRVVVSFPLNVTPLCQIAKELLDEGAVGTPEHILGVNYVPYGTVYYDSGYRIYDVTRGLFLQKATHDFEYMSYLMGANIVRIAAMHTRGRIFGGSKPAGLRCADCTDAATCLESPENRKRNGSGGSTGNHNCLFAEDLGTPETGMNEDSSSAIVEFASGVHGAYTQVFYTRRDAATRGSTVSGYDGTIRFDWKNQELHRVRHHRPFSDTVKVGAVGSHGGGDIELARDFVSLIREGKPPRTPIERGIQSAYTCLAAQESAETGKFVDVRQVGSAGA